MKRIGMLRISQETNAFSPFVTQLAAFRHYRRGDDLMQATSKRGREVDGAMRAAELSGFRAAVDKHGGGRFEVVPLFSAWAIPSGPLSLDAIEHFCNDIRESLEAAGPLDGIFFSLHGALQGEGGVRPEVDFLRVLREAVGDAPIAVSADLHAHLTQAFMEQVTIFCAYHTNPHRDHKQTGFRAGHLLVRTLDGEIRPTMAWRFLPMVQGGGLTLDFLPPVRALFKQLSTLKKSGRVLDASLLMVHLWLETPDLSWSVVAITDGDQAEAEQVVEEMADQAWAVRKAMPPDMPSPKEALDKVRKARLRRRFGVACLCDASDVVGAGGPGTNTALIKVIYETAQDLLTYAAIRDATTVDELWSTPDGTRVDTRVGGREEGSSPALEVSGTVLNRKDDLILGRSVTLDLGHLKLVVCEGPPLVMRPAFFRDRGLHPSRADICVVRVFFPFRLFFLLHNRMTIYVKTNGATDFDRGARQEFRMPTWPAQDPPDWRAADRFRRGL